jgi:SAM-dependent methyltransferase
MVIIYAATIFLSAFLLFQVQPVVGKMVLPWFGGSAAVWTTCMLLFQVLLLLGYLYAHLSSRYLSPRRQALVHTALLVTAALTLPLSPSDAWKPSPSSDPALLLLGMLVATVGLPYFLLSSTGPLLQHWFAAERPGSLPYRLFALSNFGSMLGLLSFPLAFEPALTMTAIGNAWSVGFIAFAALSATLAVRAASHAAGAFGVSSVASMAPADGGAIAALGASGDIATAERGRATGTRGMQRAARAEPVRAAAAIVAAGEASLDTEPSRRDLALWCGLAAVATVFLMAATSHLTANIAPMPLLWVLPLAIYLLTFILSFERSTWYQRRIFLPLLLGLTPLIIGYMDHPSLLPRGIAWPVAIYCAGVFVFCMSCHGELARLKPAPRHLTSFYLMIASGGALGGTFTALVAPRIFNDDYEFPLACLATLLVLAVAIGGKWAKVMLTSASLVGLAWIGALAQGDHELKERNFYGTVKVKEVDGIRQLSHGAIMHGMQFTDAARRRWPTAYFGADSGAGVAIRASRAQAAAPASAQAGGQKVGIVGLGAGTLAAYCQRGDIYRFYEINPLVAELAASHFSYLKDCPGKAEVIQGDARLSMEAEPDQHFDLLILDAFSGDAIPVHLLTQEAFATWFRHLKPDGVLAVHISNLYLDLAPVVANAAASLGHSAFIVTSRSNKALGTNAARWVLIGPPEHLASPAAQRLAPIPSQRLWTDNYSSIAGILH